MSFPSIIARRRTRISPWVELLEKTVQFGPDEDLEVYHCVTQAAYVGALIRTGDGRIPIVRQFRPAVEEYTWEFPAGTVDPGETPEEAVRRELREETGLVARELAYLGSFHADTGRLQVASHGFYGSAESVPDDFTGEAGVTVRLVSHSQLKSMILAGEFRHQGHLALYAAALVRGLDLG